MFPGKIKGFFFKQPFEVSITQLISPCIFWQTNPLHRSYVGLKVDLREKAVVCSEIQDPLNTTIKQPGTKDLEALVNLVGFHLHGAQNTLIIIIKITMYLIYQCTKGLFQSSNRL